MERCNNCLLPISVKSEKCVGRTCKCKNPKVLVLPKGMITCGS